LAVTLPLDRAADNRRRTRALGILLCLAAFPAVAFVGQYIAFVFLLWMLPVFGGWLGWVAFFALDALLVVALLAGAYAWMYRNATRDLLREVRALPLLDDPDHELRRASENMAIAAGLPPPILYVIEAPGPNLLAVGTRPDGTAIIATTGLLVLLDRRELEAAVAHATAAIANGDTRLDTLLAAGIRWLRLPGTLVARGFMALARFAGRFGFAGWGCFIGLVAWLGIPLLLSIAWGFQDPDIRPLAVISAAFLVYVFAGAPIIAALLARLVMRERKHLADAEAVQLTRYPVALVRALAKADAAGSTYAAARPETANLHFLDPVLGGGWLVRLLNSHPPAASRIAAAERLGAVVPPDEASGAAGLGRMYAADVPRPEERGQSPAAETLDAVPRQPSRLELIRVVEDTLLLEQPAPSARVRSRISAGTRVTVLAEVPGYLEVVTPADQFGFIPAESRFEVGDRPPHLSPAASDG
jgi:heat shock protein HtpX